MIRVAVADDHPLVLEGVGTVLGKAAGEVRMVGFAKSGDELLTLLGKHPVDVAIVDISMPGPGILDLLRLLRKDYPQLRTIVLSVHSAEQYGRRVLLEGAIGYVTKERGADSLVDAVRAAARGDRYVVGGAPPGVEEPERDQALSEREEAVVLALGRGESITDIADNLRLSPKSVSTYRARALKKLHCKTNADLVRYLVAKGINV
jgi:two-component system, NarL family, invasion response regulator UvrY